MGTIKSPGKVVANSKLSVEVRNTTSRTDALYNALVPETKFSPKSTTKISKSRNGQSVILTFESQELSSLRASFNTNLRLVSTSLNTLEAFSKK